MKDYLDELRRLLEERDYADIDDTMSYFEEMINDRIDSGESEEEIFEEMASPLEVAEELCRDIPEGKKKESDKGRKVYYEAEIRSIDIDVASYDVRIYPAEGKDCILEYDTSRFLDLDVSFDGRELEISQNKVFSSLFNLGRSESGVIDLRIPMDTVRECEIGTYSGDIAVYDMNLREAEIKTVSGDLELKNLYAEELEMSTVSGDVSAVQVQSREINAETVSGEISLEYVLTDEIDISTVSGDVDLLIEGAKEEYDIDISKLRHSESYKGRGDKELSVSTVSGKVRYSFTD